MALLLFMACPAILNTHSPAALVAIVQNVFLAGSLRAGNSNLWSRHDATPGEGRHTLVPPALSVALNLLLMSLSHAQGCSGAKGRERVGTAFAHLFHVLL